MNSPILTFEFEVKVVLLKKTLWPQSQNVYVYVCWRRGWGSIQKLLLQCDCALELPVNLLKYTVGIFNKLPGDAEVVGS